VAHDAIDGAAERERELLCEAGALPPAQLAARARAGERLRIGVDVAEAVAEQQDLGAGARSPEATVLVHLLERHRLRREERLVRRQMEQQDQVPEVARLPHDAGIARAAGALDEAPLDELAREAAPRALHRLGSPVRVGLEVGARPGKEWRGIEYRDAARLELGHEAREGRILERSRNLAAGGRPGGGGGGPRG